VIERFESIMTSNCYVVSPYKNNSICYLIDLPPDFDAAIQFVKTNNLSIGGVLLTHGHYDHTLGLKSYDEEHIYMNLNDEFLARNPKEQLSSLLLEAMNPLMKSNDINLHNYDGSINDVFEHSFDFLKVLENPGHTKGSVSFEFDDLGVVFTGDFVFAEGIGRTDLFSGSSEEMKESINSVFLQLDPDYDIFPGHGKSDSFKNILKYNSYLWEFIND